MVVFRVTDGLRKKKVWIKVTRIHSTLVMEVKVKWGELLLPFELPVRSGNLKSLPPEELATGGASVVLRFRGAGLAEEDWFPTVEPGPGAGVRREKGFREAVGSLTFLARR